jgi:Holliday junction resolvase RusA-like endonuclease
MTVDYYLADRRMPDVGNLISATCDLLQDASIVYNDSQIWTITAAISGIDRKNPRTELILDIKKPDWWRE